MSQVLDDREGDRLPAADQEHSLIVLHVLLDHQAHIQPVRRNEKRLGRIAPRRLEESSQQRWIVPTGAAANLLHHRRLGPPSGPQIVQGERQMQYPRAQRDVGSLPLIFRETGAVEILVLV